MSFPRYPTYKLSGVQWLGEVPEHWEVGHSRRRFALRNERALDGEEQLTASQKHGIIRQADFVESEGRRVVEVIKGADILKHVEVGDFVISMRSFQGGIEYSPYCGSISSAYVMLKPIKDVHPGFFRWLFKSSRYIQALQSTSNLVRDGQALRFSNFAQVDIPVIPMSEQASIATFLDHETAKIDALIAEQQHLIELLQEKRQAVISHAVTKGLNPDAPMKDSGVEWLGEVPEHWEIKSLKNLVRMKSGDFITADSIEIEGTYPVFGGNGLRGFTENFNREGDHALIGRQGALCGNINKASGKFWASEHAIVCDHKSETSLAWLCRMLESANLNQYSTSAAQPGLSVEVIGNTRIPCPPSSEQTIIGKWIDNKLSEIDSVMETSRHLVDVLGERRSALISAAVTGQIDVRGLASQGDPV
jgi:type I restriction enzyme S subunit